MSSGLSIDSKNDLLRGKTICLVDDDTEQLEILEQFLTPRGIITTAFNNGRDAVKYLEHHTPDLLLLDIMMPEMDGWMLYTTLRNDPRLAKIPVLFVTCLADSETESRMQDGKKCASLRKPVERDQLFKKIEWLLS